MTGGSTKGKEIKISISVFPGKELLARYQLIPTAAGNAKAIPKSETFKETKITSKSSAIISITIPSKLFASCALRFPSSNPTKLMNYL